LITLLEINIVANNIFGDSINRRMILCFCSEDSCNLFLSDGDRPKNAISEPEIKPDPINKKKQERNGIKKL
tara:strand:- start:270 stop:482 length:213 start_codon:yes stop_codon:yes gene_type:complete